MQFNVRERGSCHSSDEASTLGQPAARKDPLHLRTLWGVLWDPLSFLREPPPVSEDGKFWPLGLRLNVSRG